MTENNTLTEQMESLYNEVRSLAESMSVLYITEKQVEQKSNVIGRALVEQKQVSERVLANQTKVEEHFKEAQTYSENQTGELQIAMEHVMSLVKQLQGLENTENKLTDSFDQLSKEQTTFMEQNQDNIKETITDLNAIKESVAEIRNQFENLEMEEQVAFMIKKISNMQANVQAYGEMQQQVVNTMDEQIKKTESQVLFMREELNKQIFAVAEVVNISHQYEEKTIEICNKLESFLKEQSNTKDKTLEEMFPPQEEKNRDVEKEQPEENLVEKKNGFFARLFRKEK